MKLFGTKRPEPTDEDRAAAARLSALAARYKPGTSSDLTDVSPDPLGGEPETAEEPEGPADSREPGSEE